MNLGDRRAAKSRNGADWAPLDLMGVALEDIKPGGCFENATGAVLVLLVEGEENGPTVAYYSAGTNRITALGMLMDAIDTINHPTY